MRILFILENYYPNIGGVETLFKSICESLVEKGYEVTVFTNRFSKQLKRQETVEGVNIIRANLKNRYLFTFFAGFSATRLAKKHDLIHTTSYNAALPAYIAALLSGKKVLISFHEVWGKLWFNLPFMNKVSLFLHYCFEAFILKLPFDKFVAVSKSTKQSLINSGIREEKVEMIYNGIDYDDFRVKQIEKPTKAVYRFCYFGRLGISKGLDLIIDAVAILGETNSDFEFLLILPESPAPFLKEIKRRIKAKSLEKYFVIRHSLGFEELKSTIHASNAVVIPSYSEGFCFAAVESMALGVPIVSSGKAALNEVVGGTYIEMEQQSAHALAHALKKAMLDEWQYRKTKRFELRDSIMEYMRLYEGTLHK